MNRKNLGTLTLVGHARMNPVLEPLAGLYLTNRQYMSWKGPKVGLGMIDFVEDNFVGVKLH